MSCGATDIACNVQQALLGILMTFVLPVVFLLVIVMVGWLGGKTGKRIAAVAFVVWLIYYVAPLLGFPQVHDFLSGLAIAPLMVKQVRHVREDPHMPALAKVGFILVAVAFVLVILVTLKVV